MTFFSALPGHLQNCGCLFIITCFPDTASGGQSVSQARGKRKESLWMTHISCTLSSLKCNSSEICQKELKASLSLDPPLRAGWCCPPSVVLSTWHWAYISIKTFSITRPLTFLKWHYIFRPSLDYFVATHEILCTHLWNIHWMKKTANYDSDIIIRWTRMNYRTDHSEKKKPCLPLQNEQVLWKV